MELKELTSKVIELLNIENPEVVDKSYPNFWEDFGNVVI